MSKFRWAAEFLAGPGGNACMEEVWSEWFSSEMAAKKDAENNAKNEVTTYPFSRGNILKLIIEDDRGNITVLKDSKSSRNYHRSSSINLLLFNLKGEFANTTL
jgi:hypothetical protein